MARWALLTIAVVACGGSGAAPAEDAPVVDGADGDAAGGAGEPAELAGIT